MTANAGNVLAEAAFGADPGRWPLPQATDATGLWLRAVAAGGQGRYCSARADLASLMSRTSPPGLVSLAHSTRASFLRQQGWHRLAHDADGTALACAGGCAEARTDALVGLAADALGVRRLAVAGVLLARAEQVHAGADSPPPRLAIRLAWVRAACKSACRCSWLAVRLVTNVRWPKKLLKMRPYSKPWAHASSMTCAKNCSAIGMRCATAWP